jgi:transposase
MVISYLARLQLLSRLGLLTYILRTLKVGDTLDHTLFVGIDVSKHSNFVYAMNLNSEKLLTSCVPNTQDGANQIESKLLKLLEQHGLTKVIVVLESTGVYSAHVATYLSASKALSVFDIRVYIINPKISRNYRKSFADMDKTDPRDAFVLADLARVGRMRDATPFKGAQRLALERLTRHRLHIAELLSTEKVYALNNVFLKFSNFETLFSNNFGNTAVDLLLEYKSLDDILNTPLEDLAAFITKSSKNRFDDSKGIADKIQIAARNSYRLDKMSYDPINMSLASSLNVIHCYQNEIKDIDQAIIRQVAGFNQDHYDILLSIPGIGKVYAAGILAEIAHIDQFESNDALAKYAGITWRKHQSGNFEADDTYMTKTGNKYLRYFIIQAANAARIWIPEYRDFYKKKYNEVTNHQHKRALALTARKLIRLIFGLLSTNRLYQSN